MKAITKEEAEILIQERLLKIGEIMDEVKSIADGHQIEFSIMGLTYHFRDYYDANKVAKTGFLAADNEWWSSDFGCSPGGDYWGWRRKNWPEDFDDD